MIQEPTEGERMTQALLDIIDILLAKRNVDQALSALDEGNRLVAEGLNSNGYKGKISCDYYQHMSRRQSSCVIRRNM